MSKNKSGNCVITTADGWTGSHIMQASKQFEHCFQKIIPCAVKGSKVDHKDVVYFDPENVQECMNCFKNASCVILVPPASGNKAHILEKYLQVCKDANVEHVVLVSMIGAGEPGDNECMKEFAHMEQMVQNSGIKGFCIVRLGFYAENLLLYKDQIREGKLPVPLPEGKLTVISLVDVGHAIMKLCEKCSKEPSKHTSGVMELTGCELLSGEEMAQRVSRGLGKEVKLQVITDQQACDILSTTGIDKSEQQVLMEAYHLARKGKMSKVTNDVEKLLGHKPTTLDKFFMQHKQEFA